MTRVEFLYVKSSAYVTGHGDNELLSSAVSIAALSAEPLTSEASIISATALFATVFCKTVYLPLSVNYTKPNRKNYKPKKL